MRFRNVFGRHLHLLVRMASTNKREGRPEEATGTSSEAGQAEKLSEAFLSSVTFAVA
jgi:hypothetical protein